MARKTATRSKTKKKTTRSGGTAVRGAAASKSKSTKKKSTKKKTTTKKASTKKKVSKKKVSRPASKATSKKKAASKPPRSKTAGSKASPSKKKAVTKKVTSKKTSSKKVPAKKASGKKVVAKKAPKKAVTKKVPAKKAPAKKAPAEKKAATKAPSKKTSKKAPVKKRSRSRGSRSVAEVASSGQADAQGYIYINGRRVRMISTGGVPVTKRKTTTDNSVPIAAAAPAKKIKTNLTAKELRRYKNLLLQKRAELIGDVSAMESAALNAPGGNLSTLPIHMADVGSDTYEQDFTLSLAETERKRLNEIVEALMRISDKTYGICQMTGKPIPEARLEAKPWAKYTIEAARMMERQGNG